MDKPKQELEKAATTISKILIYGFTALGIIGFFIVVDILKPTHSTTLFAGIVLGVLLAPATKKKDG